jgi:hypothetical protein
MWRGRVARRTGKASASPDPFRTGVSPSRLWRADFGMGGVLPPSCRAAPGASAAEARRLAIARSSRAIALDVSQSIERHARARASNNPKRKSQTGNDRRQFRVDRQYFRASYRIQRSAGMPRRQAVQPAEREISACNRIAINQRQLLGPSQLRPLLLIQQVPVGLSHVVASRALARESPRTKTATPRGVGMRKDAVTRVPPSDFASGQITSASMRSSRPGTSPPRSAHAARHALHG